MPLRPRTAASEASYDSRAAQASRAVRSQHPVVPPDVPPGPGRRRPGRHAQAPRTRSRPIEGATARRARPQSPLRGAGTIGETEPGKSQQTKTNHSHVSGVNIASRAPACTQAGARGISSRGYGQHAKPQSVAIRRPIRPSASIPLGHPLTSNTETGKCFVTRDFAC